MQSGDYPLPAFYFKVVFASSLGMLDSAFQEVSGISHEMETESVVEGGNQHALQLPKSLKHGNLVLKRGIADMSSPLVLWCRAVLESNFALPIVPQLIQVHLLNADNTPVRAWSFSNAFPVKWSVDGFNSTKNEVAIESIELSYSTSIRTI